MTKKKMTDVEKSILRNLKKLILSKQRLKQEYQRLTISLLLRNNYQPIIGKTKNFSLQTTL